MKKFILSLCFLFCVSSLFCEFKDIDRKYVRNNSGTETNVALCYDKTQKLYSVSIMAVQDAFYVVQFTTFFKTKSKAYEAYTLASKDLYVIKPVELSTACESIEGIQQDFYEGDEDIFAVTYTLWEQ